LWQPGQVLPRETVSDLYGWGAASGPLGVRSAATLAAHYRRAFLDQPNPSLLPELQACVFNTQAPTTLRHDLARLLYQQDELPPQDLERLLGTGNAAPLRLFAADALLAKAEHLEAVRTLRELARVPNRELAVATASIVQRRLGAD